MLKRNLKTEYYKFNFKHYIPKNIGKKQKYTYPDFSGLALDFESI